MNETKQVFFSQPLRALRESSSTDEDRYRKFYRDVADACQKHGYIVYQPIEHTDPAKAESLGSNRVYGINMDKLYECDLMVAYVGLSSNGVGAEVQAARSANIPLIILYEIEREAYVSRMMKAEVDGNVIGIIGQYPLEEIASQLDRQFEQFEQHLELEESTDKPINHIQILQNRGRELNLSQRAIAKLLDKDPGYINRVLKGDEDKKGKINKPDRDFLLMLCLYALKMNLADTSSVLKGFGHEGLYGF